MANLPTRDPGEDGGEDATSDSIDFGSLLTGSESADGISFSLASGINVGRVAQAVLGSVVFSIIFGVTTIIDAVTDTFGGLIDGLASFFGDELIDATLVAGIGAIEGAWAFTLDEFGGLGYAIGLAVVVGTFYLAGRSFDMVQGVLDG